MPTSSNSTSSDLPRICKKEEYNSWKKEFEGYAARKNFLHIMNGTQLEPTPDPTIPDPPGEIDARLRFEIDHANHKIREKNSERNLKWSEKRDEGFGSLKQATARYPSLSSRIANEFPPGNTDCNQLWWFIRESHEQENLSFQLQIETKLKDVHQGTRNFDTYLAEIEDLYAMIPPVDPNIKKLTVANGLHSSMLPFSDSILNVQPYDTYVECLRTHETTIKNRIAQEARTTNTMNQQTKHAESEKTNEGLEAAVQTAFNAAWNAKMKSYGNRGRGRGRGGRGRSGRGRGGRGGRGRGNHNDNEDSSDGKGWDKSKVKCYNCQGYGHFAKDCASKSTKKQKKE